MTKNGKEKQDHVNGIRLKNQIKSVIFILLKFISDCCLCPNDPEQGNKRSKERHH